MRKLFAICLAIGALLISGIARADPEDKRPDAAAQAGFGELETGLVSELVINSLGMPPADPSNRFADDPRAAMFGEILFFDTRLSVDGTVTCGTCHVPAKQFQDGLPMAMGIAVTNRRTMPLAGVAWNKWFFWDGRKDSLWSQALEPFENPLEHGLNRTRLVHMVSDFYHEDYAAIFGPLPELAGIPLDAAPTGNAAVREAWAALSADQRRAINRAFANIGKAIAAYQRRLVPAETRLDRYIREVVGGLETVGEPVFSELEIEGLKIFAGKGRCITCHQGPLMTDGFFHNTGVPSGTGQDGRPQNDQGRVAVLETVEADPFNCLGPFSDANEQQCGELMFMQRDPKALLRAFKTPTLRGVSQRPPYMHAGQFSTLVEVIRHYNEAPKAEQGHSELVPLQLGEEEIKALAAFLDTL